MSQKIYTPVATFPSSSNPNKTYTVSEDQYGELSCNCPAWTFKKGGDRTCKHVQEVENQRRLGLVAAVAEAGDPVEVQADEREKGGVLEEIFKKLEKGR